MNIFVRVKLGVAFALVVALAGCAGSLQAASAPLGSIALRSRSDESHLPVNNASLRYKLIVLRGLGGNFAEGNSVGDGWVAGFASLRNNTVEHAVLWREKRARDLGTLGGPNSVSDYPIRDEVGEISGYSETSQTDPNLENFCAFATRKPTHLCLGFRWRNGVMSALPTLGGNNAFAAAENARREIVGIAETAARDSNCGAPQVFDFEGLIWRPDGTTISLPPYRTDAVSAAFGINDRGDAVGASGVCGPLSLAIAAHAIFWTHGMAMDLGNLGGSAFNVADAINNRGQIAGISGLADGSSFHAFLWQKGEMTDLGTLPGGVDRLSSSINNEGQIVGYSINPKGKYTAYLWEHGSMEDLNRLVPPTRLHLMIASDIDDRGWIVGDALDSQTGKTVGYVLIPKNDGSAE